ncbi:MAG: hypothetical protein NW208_17590 [Bryobacter sp.]|nr:hypothetical protein [Bryobacter sp.]
MKTVGFATPRGSHIKYLGLALPSDCTAPNAYILYFRHTANPSDYPNDESLLKLGIGDMLAGRMQFARQISASGKNVAVVTPMGLSHLGEFTQSPEYIENCLHSIEDYLGCGGQELPPLLLACYSDGIGELNKFLTNCGRLLPKVRAIYDFDGSLVLRFRNVNFSQARGAQIIRYNGTVIPGCMLTHGLSATPGL